MSRSDLLAPWAPALLVGVVPLVVLPGAFGPFHAGKWLLVLVLVPIGLAVCAAGPGLRWPYRNWIVPWLGVVAVSTALGVAPWMSVAGSPNRNAGVLAAIAGVGAFVLGASVGDQQRAQRLVLRVAMLSGAVVGLLAIVEFVGLDLLGFGDLADAARARSTWGSATFAGAHLVIVLPNAVAHIRSRATMWRNIAIGSSILTFVGLLATGTRGAWLGLIVAAVPLGLAWKRSGPTDTQPTRMPKSVLVGGGVLAAVAVILLAGPALSRSTTVGRVELWSTAIPVALDRPILGSGPDTQRVVLPAGIDAEFEAKHGSTELHDRAHNLVLDTLVTTGLVGAIAFGAVLVVIGIGIARRARGQLVSTAIGAGLLGYLVTLMFAFGDPTIDPIAWLLAGLVLGSNHLLQAQGQNDSAAMTGKRKSLLVVGFGVLAFGGLLWGGGEVLAEYRLGSAMKSRSNGELEAALDSLSSGASLAPARFDLDQLAVRMITQSAMVGQLPDSGQDLVHEAEKRLDRAERVAGDDPDLLMDRAEFLTATDSPEAALKVYDRVMVQYPNSFRAQLGRGIAAAATDQVELAQRSWRLAEDLGPRDTRARLNLGLLYEETGRPDEALASFRAVLKIDPDNSTALAGVERVSPPSRD